MLPFDLVYRIVLCLQNHLEYGAFMIVCIRCNQDEVTRYTAKQRVIKAALQDEGFSKQVRTESTRRSQWMCEHKYHMFLTCTIIRQSPFTDVD
jgi:hypothetical protein